MVGGQIHQTSLNISEVGQVQTEGSSGKYSLSLPLEKKSVCNKSAQTCLEYAQTLQKVCFFEIDQYAEACESMRKFAGFLQTYETLAYLIASLHRVCSLSMHRVCKNSNGYKEVLS